MSDPIDYRMPIGEEMDLKTLPDAVAWGDLWHKEAKRLYYEAQHYRSMYEFEKKLTAGLIDNLCWISRRIK